MAEEIQGKPSITNSPLIKKLSRPAWDTYDSVTLLVLGGFLIFYFLFNDLYVDYLWGDFGRWHDEVKRFAQGESIYKDFTWPYPPLALYLYGWLARAFGNSFLTVRLISTGITIAIAFLVFLIARHCVPKKFLPMVVLASMMMGIGNSNLGGETLGAGMYTPAVPVGILMSLLCLFGSIRYIAGFSKRWLYVTGAGFAGALLAKQDFWMPVLACALILLIYQWQSRSSIANFGKEAARWVLTALVISVGGCLLVIMQSGLSMFMAGISGFGLARSGIGRMYPTWRKICDSVLFLSVFAVLGSALMRWSRIISRKKASWLLIAGCVVALLAGSVRVIMTYRVGSLVASGDTEIIHTRTGSYFSGRAATKQQVLMLTAKHIIVTAMVNAIPLLVTILSAVVFLWIFWKHRDSPIIKVASLLAIWVIAARTRRLFESVDVIHLLVEPLFFILAIQIACIYKSVNPGSCRHLTLGVAIVFIVIGLSLFAFYEVQPRIRYAYEKITTERGSIKLPSDQAAEFRTLENLITSYDPSGLKPLLNWPSYNRAALNYMLDRKNPARMTLTVELMKIQEVLSKQRPIVICDPPLMPRTSAETSKAPARTQIPMREFFDLSVWEPKAIKTNKTADTSPSGQQRSRQKFYTYLMSLGYRRMESPGVGSSQAAYEIYVPLQP